MESVNEKFNNFKKFILTIDCQNTWITWFQDIDLASFMLTVREKNHLSGDEIFNEIIKTTNIDKEKLNDSINDKLKRYISYFHEVSKIL